MSSATGYRLEEKVGASWQTVYSGANPQFAVAGRAAGDYPYQVWPAVIAKLQAVHAATHPAARLLRTTDESDGEPEA